MMPIWQSFLRIENSDYLPLLRLPILHSKLTIYSHVRINRSKILIPGKFDWWYSQCCWNPFASASVWIVWQSSCLVTLSFGCMKNLHILVDHRIEKKHPQSWEEEKLDYIPPNYETLYVVIIYFFVQIDKIPKSKINFYP